MKINQNIKIRSVYKALAVAALISASNACTTQKNVVIQVKKFDSTFVLLRDIETGRLRYYRTSSGKYDDLQYLCGDTVLLVVLPNNFDDGYYLNKRIIEDDKVKLYYNTDSVSHRRQREEFARIRQRLENEMNSNKVHRLPKEYQK